MTPLRAQSEAIRWIEAHAARLRGCAYWDVMPNGAIRGNLPGRYPPSPVMCPLSAPRAIMPTSDMAEAHGLSILAATLIVAVSDEADHTDSRYRAVRSILVAALQPEAGR